MSEYPSDEELERIKQWEFETPESFEAFMAFVKSVGHYWPEETFGWGQCEREYRISTGGWSGNESILGAMQDNLIFWTVCWWEHQRGGHYVFKLPDPTTYFGGKP